MARLYLVGYDIGDDICQADFRQVVKSYAITGQKSAYECELTSQQKSHLQEFFSANISANDACCVIAVKQCLWQTSPKKTFIQQIFPHFIYIG